jgi:hypothetical protein
MHAKAFDSLIVFNDWIKALLLELLPISAQLIFIVRVE